MDHTANAKRWPALDKDDEGLQKEIEALLSAYALGDPYSSDGGFAQNLSTLPRGLRAMAATHWLDISLTLDSITWHFGNFGEAHLVAETEAGLIELGLHDLASCFHEAKDLILPLLPEIPEGTTDFDEFLEQKGVQQLADDLNQRAWSLDNLGPGKSIIYDAWIRYTRQHPEHVFDISRP
jgi:hypothetical protein